jgi:hypothetical protein
MSDQPIVDAHHHIWRLDAVPWLKGPQVPRIFGDYGPLRRDYLIGEYLRNCQAQGVEKSVFIQINVAPGAEVEEVAWAQSVADSNGFPHGIVGYANLAAPDHRRGAGPAGRLRQSARHPAAAALAREAALPLREDGDADEGSGLAGRGSPSSTAAAFPSTSRSSPARWPMPPSSRGRIRRRLHPAARRHAGGPQHPKAGRPGARACGSSPPARTSSRSSPASAPSSMPARSSCGSRWSWRRWRSSVSPARCLFGSNWPIETLWTDYAAIVATTRECLVGLTREERAAVLHDNAAGCTGCDGRHRRPGLRRHGARRAPAGGRRGGHGPRPRSRARRAAVVAGRAWRDVARADGPRLRDGRPRGLQRRAGRGRAVRPRGPDGGHGPADLPLRHHLHARARRRHRASAWRRAATR